ncbi:hypothetical protein [Trichlorobacter lovleyi]|uniref:hypothetical protein n=1 Tax=Trichlorobacter lovleyi TaxID=313985 RepID=UPI003D0A2643
MNIDFNKTHAACGVLNLAAVARELTRTKKDDEETVSRSMVSKVLTNTYPRMQSPGALRVLEYVRARNLLVEVDHVESLAA